MRDGNLKCSGGLGITPLALQPMSYTYNPYNQPLTPNTHSPSPNPRLNHQKGAYNPRPAKAMSFVKSL